MTSVNLIAYDNGVGLSRDVALLADTLRAGGLDITVTRVSGDRRARGGFDPRTRLAYLFQRLRGKPPPHYDINVMIERIRPFFFAQAKKNLLLANPDWFKDSDARNFAAIDAVLVKTRHAEAIFAARGKPIAHIGFTSADRLLPAVPRERAFFHLAGRSSFKGTSALLELWLRHPQWPRLTVVQNLRDVSTPIKAPNIDHRLGHVDEAELQYLQNLHAFHLCPSETEGFGHYLVEAMSVGALVITTDAPPMNELIAPARGVLVPWIDSRHLHLATLYRFDPVAMEMAIEHVLAMDAQELAGLSARARAWYEANDHEFRARAAAVIGAFV